MNGKELLQVVLVIGEKLMYYGAEVYRVEESIEKMCSAYGYEGTEIFAIPPTLVVTVRDGKGSHITRSVRVADVSADLDRVGRYNSLSRRICAEKPCYDEITAEIDRIEASPVYSKPIQLMGYMTVGFAFAVVFGGDIIAALLASVSAGTVYFLTEFLEDAGAGDFLTRFVCSAAAALFGAVLCGKRFPDRCDIVIISALMTMVPGVSITNCMRNFISGDLLAGLYTLADAFTAAVAMAVGAGTVLSFTGV